MLPVTCMHNADGPDYGMSAMAKMVWRMTSTLWYAVLGCTMLCRAVLCRAMLCTLCWDRLCNNLLCSAAALRCAKRTGVAKALALCNPLLGACDTCDGTVIALSTFKFLSVFIRIRPGRFCCAALAALFCPLLCCAVLCCAVLCCAVLCCAVLCCAVLCCAVLCCAESSH